MPPWGYGSWAAPYHHRMSFPVNPRLDRLHPYPFERLRELTAGITPNPDLAPISLGIGEPRHAAPALIAEAINGSMKSLAA